jgi:hypothetical protein
VAVFKSFLSEHVFWQQLVLIVLFLFAVIYAFSRGIIFKKGDMSIGFGPGEKKKKLPPHATCPHRIDFYLLVDKIAEVEFANAKDLFYGVRDSQMGYTQERLIDLKHRLLDNYCSLIKKIKPTENVTAHRDYVDFEVFIETLLNRLTDKIQQDFIRNGLEDKELNQFNSYCEEKSNQLFQSANIFCNQYYTSENRIVSRDELRDSWDRMRSDFIALFTDIFVNGRDVILKTKDRMKRRYDDKTNWLSEHIGIEVTSSFEH